MIIYHSNIMKYEAWIFSATPEDTTGDVANENPEECADSAGEHNHLYILCLSVCLFVVVVVVVSNKRQNGYTDWDQILCRT